MSVDHFLCHSFCRRREYKSISGAGQEQILLVLRAHPITNLPWLLVLFLMIVIPLLFGQHLALLKLSFYQLLFVVCFWYALALLYALYQFFFWYFNIGVITNQRIVDVDAVNLLHGHTTAINLHNIEQVSKRSLGIMAGLFNYADIHIETATAFPDVEFLKAPKPHEIIKIINSSLKNHRAD